MKNNLRRLPDGELLVMQAIWACTPPVSRDSINDILGESHSMALTTLLTVLTRLSEKGFIQIVKEGRAARYIPLVSQKEYLAGQSRHFLDNLCGGNISTFATALCDSGLSREELMQLRELLERGGL